MKKVVLVVSSKRLKAGCPTCEAAKKFWKRLKKQHSFGYQEIDIDTKQGSNFAEKHSIQSAPTTVIDGKVVFVGLPKRNEAIKLLRQGDLMQLQDFSFVVETEKQFDEAVVAVRKAVESKGWAIFQVHDYRELLAVKGFKQKPLKIIEICSGKYANQFLNNNRLTSLCMPCKINVLEEEGKVKIAGMKPTAISLFFPEVGKWEAEEAERDIAEIIDNAK